ncbi:unnamed protein product [Paramecium pentaurelia]|uniref:Mitochondrial carrier protein n=1 Tax=Paramecium pentaurelia TaxID=43138 RepID=A0A8S1XNF9_9CILI|nr:unnamed protein product [Paramecium pentaurelia]
MVEQQRVHFQGLLGATASLISTLAVQPLEVIKMVMIVKSNPKNYRLTSAYGSVEYILINEGLNGFYRGLRPAIVRNMSAGFLYFQMLSYVTSVQRNVSQDFLASFFARGISNFITNPILLIETRAEVPGYQYTSLWKTANTIAKQEGLMSFFKGGLTCSIKDSLFAGIYYVVYRKMHEILLTADSGFSPSITFLSGMIAGLVGTCASHPFEILRARLQTNYYDDQMTIMQRFKSTYQNEGLYGFTKGLSPRLVRKPLANSLSFLLVEHLNHIFYGTQFHS